MRTLPIGLIVLGFMGIAGLGICGGNEKVKKEMIAQEKATKKIVSPTTSLNKVVIGVLDCEVIGPRPSNLDGFVKSPTSALHCIPCPVKLKAAISRDMGYRGCLKTVTSNKENI